MDDSLSQSIISVVKHAALTLAPNLTFQPKYGGEVFVPDADQPKRFVGGVFASRFHVSVEFSEGASFDDPAGHLEGKGKGRRHLKLHSVAEVEAKDLTFFLRQALA